jgi:hypothetical protein
MGVPCGGVSQPFFGIAEDWAHGTGAAPPVSEFYVVGAIEFSGATKASDVFTATAAIAKYGTGAYEVRILRLDIHGVGSTAWDSGNGTTTSTIRSNCELPTGVITNTATPAECLRSNAHSTFLTARLSDNDTTQADRAMMVGGVG